MRFRSLSPNNQPDNPPAYERTKNGSLPNRAQRRSRHRKPRVVEAAQKKQAINHVAADTLVATVISTKEAMALAKLGVELETAGEGDGE